MTLRHNIVYPCVGTHTSDQLLQLTTLYDIPQTWK